MLKSEIEWKPIATAPMGERIFVADLIDRIRYIGLGEQDADGSVVFVCPGIPATPAGHWTHWAPMPDLPPWTDAAPLPANDAPRDLTVDGLLKLVDKLERAHKAQAEIAWQHYQRAGQAEVRLDVLETAVADVLRFVSRGDWNNLRPETRAALEGGGAMSDDLEKRLRATTDGATVNPDGPEAATRIAELEAALQSIVEYCDDPYLPYYKDILSKARAALEGVKDA